MSDYNLTTGHVLSTFANKGNVLSTNHQDTSKLVGDKLDAIKQNLLGKEQKRNYILSVVMMFPEDVIERELKQFMSFFHDLNSHKYEVVLCRNVQSDNREGSFIENIKDNVVFVKNHFKTFEFDTARNEAKKHASGEWILSLDLDEYLATPIHAVLNAVQSINEEIEAIMCTVLSHTRDDKQPYGYERTCGYATRLFRNRPHIQWMSRCHEIINFTVDEQAIANSSITIIHTGYDAELEVLEHKLNRNLELLAREFVDPRNAETKEHAKALLVNTCYSYKTNILERG